MRCCTLLQGWMTWLQVIAGPSRMFFTQRFRGLDLGDGMQDYLLVIGLSLCKPEDMGRSELRIYRPLAQATITRPHSFTASICDFPGLNATGSNVRRLFVILQPETWWQDPNSSTPDITNVAKLTTGGLWRVNTSEHPANHSRLSRPIRAILDCPSSRSSPG
jgi:hypothetical protein